MVMVPMSPPARTGRPVTGQPDPIAATTAYGDAVGRRDVETAVALFAPEGTIVPGNVPGLPFGGVATGPDAIRRFLSGQFEHMELQRHGILADTGS